MELDALRQQSKQDATVQTVEPPTRMTDHSMQVSDLDSSGAHGSASLSIERHPVKRPLFSGLVSSKRRKVDRNAPESFPMPDNRPWFLSEVFLQQRPHSTSTPLFRSGLREEDFGHRTFVGRPPFLGSRLFGSFAGRDYSPSPSVASPGASTINGRFDEELDAFPRFPSRFWPEETENAALGDSWDDGDEGDDTLVTFGPDFAFDEHTASQDKTTQESEVDPADFGREETGAHAGRELTRTLRSDDASHAGSPEEDTLLEDTAAAARATSNTTARRSKRIAAPLPKTAPSRKKAAGSKKRKGPAKLKNEVTDFDQFIFVPEDGDEGQLKPVSELPPPTATRLQAALETLYQGDFKRACTVTRAENSNTYVDSGKCIGLHLFQRSKKDLAPSTASCSTCTSYAGIRPCVRLEACPSTLETILIFYPRSADRRPSNAVWTEPQFWLGRGA